MLLQCQNLTMRFPSGFVAGPLTLQLGPGIHHLQGRNGSGKTTLLRCLCGGWRMSEGVVHIRGRDPRHDPLARRDVALVAAEPELPAFLTVDEAWQELAALRGAPRWDGHALREHLGLPQGLPLGHCSAGQRRLAELLAAAAADPAVLLLDEPFANLDPVSVQRVADCMLRWRAERALVLTSHGPLPLEPDTVLSLS
jgi:ABC-2 type transport system ATP-binding protein